MTDDRRLARPPKDSTRIESIRVDFAIPTYLTPGQQRRLYDLIDEIVDRPWNAPAEGVHWLSGHGSMPRWSRADATFLGREPDPDAPDTGEPTFDDSVLHFETTARAFVCEEERRRVTERRERRTKPMPEPMTNNPEHSPTPWRVTMKHTMTHGNYPEIDDADGNAVADFAFSDSTMPALDAVNAAFIVRAANAHDGLVAALRALLDATEYLTDKGPPGEGWQSDGLEAAIAAARAAVARAGGR